VTIEVKLFLTASGKKDEKTISGDIMVIEHRKESFVCAFN